MSNLYTTTTRIHELLPKINQKYGLKIEVESDFLLLHDGQLQHEFEYKHINNHNGQIVRPLCIQAIQAPQISQIIIALQDVLGENHKYTRLKFNILTDRYELFGLVVKDEDDKEYKRDLQSEIDYQKGKISLTPKSKAKALCQKWLDGLEPLFDLVPEMVLTELVEILENLLK